MPPAIPITLDIPNDIAAAAITMPPSIPLPTNIPDNIYSDPSGQWYYPNGTAVPGLVWKPAFNMTHNPTVTAGDKALWGMGWAFIAISGFGWVAFMSWLLARERAKCQPSERLWTMWWRKLKGRRGVSSEKEARMIRMEGIKEVE
ncbi:MAG: hypothetical protein L6R39_005249 [Caloplaca ligustica]|nr:MAG: hypothetical protein L6R39_005249 [Caloplaca ligustica]